MRNTIKLFLFFLVVTTGFYFSWPSIQQAFVERALKEYVQKNLGYHVSYSSAKLSKRNILEIRDLHLTPNSQNLGTLFVPKAKMYVSLNVRKRLLTAKLTLEEMEWSLLGEESFQSIHYPKRRYLIQPVITVEGKGVAKVEGKEYPLEVLFYGAKECSLNFNMGPILSYSGTFKDVGQATFKLERFPLSAAKMFAPEQFQHLEGILSGTGTLQKGAFNFHDTHFELLGVPFAKLQGEITYRDDTLDLNVSEGRFKVFEEEGLINGKLFIEKELWDLKLNAFGEKSDLQLHVGAHQNQYLPNSALNLKAPYFSASAKFVGDIHKDPIELEVLGKPGLISERWNSKNTLIFEDDGLKVTGVLSTKIPVLSYNAKVGKGCTVKEYEFAADEIPLNLRFSMGEFLDPLFLKGSFTAQGRGSSKVSRFDASGSSLEARFGNISATLLELDLLQYVQYEGNPLLTASLKGLQLTHMPTGKKVFLKGGELLSTSKGLELSQMHLQFEDLELQASGLIETSGKRPKLTLTPSYLSGSSFSLNNLLSLFTLPKLPYDLKVTGDAEFLEGTEITLLPKPHIKAELSFNDVKAVIEETPIDLHQMSGRVSIDTDEELLTLKNISAKTNFAGVQVGTNISLKRQDSSQLDFWIEEGGRDALRLKGELSIEGDELLFIADVNSSHLMRLNPTSLTAALDSEGKLQRARCLATIPLKNALEDFGPWDVGDEISGDLQALLQFNGADSCLSWSVRSSGVNAFTMKNAALLFRGDLTANRFSIHEFSFGELTVGAEFSKGNDFWNMTFMGGSFGDLASCGFEGKYLPEKKELQAKLHMLDLELPLLYKQFNGHFRGTKGDLVVSLKPDAFKYSLDVEGLLRDFSWEDLGVDEVPLHFVVTPDLLKFSTEAMTLSSPRWEAELRVTNYSQSLLDEDYFLEGLKFNFDADASSAIASDFGRMLDVRIPQGILKPEGISRIDGSLTYQKSLWTSLTKLELGKGLYSILGVPLNIEKISFVKKGQKANVLATIIQDGNQYTAHLNYLDLLCPYGNCEIKGPNMLGLINWKTSALGIPKIQSVKLNHGALQVDVQPFGDDFTAEFIFQEYSGNAQVHGGVFEIKELLFEGTPIKVRAAPLQLTWKEEPVIRLNTAALSFESAKPLLKLFPFIDENSKIEQLYLDNLEWSLLSQKALSGRGTLTLGDSGKKGGLTPKKRIDILNVLPKLLAGKAEMQFHFSPEGLVLDSLSGTDKFRLAKMSFVKPGLYQWNGEGELSLLIEPKPVPFVKAYPVKVDYSGKVGAPHVKLERLDRPRD